MDDLKEVVENSKGQSMDGAYVVFDLETTGLSAVNNRIIEIGAVKVIEGKIVDRFSTFVNPREPIPFEIEQLTSISDEMVIDAPVIEDILPKFLEFCEGCVLIAHKLLLWQDSSRKTAGAWEQTQIHGGRHRFHGAYPAACPQ